MENFEVKNNIRRLNFLFEEQEKEIARLRAQLSTSQDNYEKLLLRIQKVQTTSTAAEKIYLNNKEAALFLGVAASTLRISRTGDNLLLGAPSPKHDKFGRSVKYKRDTLELWIAKNKNSL